MNTIISFHTWMTVLMKYRLYVQYTVCLPVGIHILSDENMS